MGKLVTNNKNSPLFKGLDEKKVNKWHTLKQIFVFFQHSGNTELVKQANNLGKIKTQHKFTSIQGFECKVMGSIRLADVPLNMAQLEQNNNNLTFTLAYSVYIPFGKLY